MKTPKKDLIFELIKEQINNLKKKNKPFIIGINGIDTSGKTTFSKELKKYLETQGFSVQLLHIDDFHNPKAIRYFGENEAENYYNKSFNLAFLINEILAPLRKNGSLDKSLKLLNLFTDEYDMEKKFIINADSIVLFEGVFLFREELINYFDYRIFLEIPLEESKKRAEKRDVPIYGEGILKKYDEKYIPAQKRYIEACNPKEKSDLIIDNSKLDFPKISKKSEVILNKTLIKDDVRKILNHYHLGEYISSHNFKTGTVQTNIFIETTNGKFVLRYYSRGRSVNSTKFEVNLINYLRKHNYPCQKIIKNNLNSCIGIYNNTTYVMFEYIEGSHIEVPNFEQKEQLIQKVAELQNITKKYKPKYKNERWNYSPDLCRFLVEKKAEEINTENAREKLKWYKKELAKINFPTSYPKGICHCDFHFSNVLFHNDKFTALIDFDDANYTYLTFDLIWLTDPFSDKFEWHNWQKTALDENVFDFSEARQVVNIYQKYRKLSKIEKKYFFDLMKLSVMLDCIWYFERGNAEDFYEKRKIEHLDRLGRENFYRAIFG